MFEKFEIALKCQYRWDTPQGLLCLEDLFELPLTTTKDERASLEKIAKRLWKEIRENEAEDGFSISNVETSNQTIVKNKFDIIKYIIEKRQAENEVRQNKEAKKKEMQLYIDLLAEAELAEKKDLTPEQLREKITALQSS